MRVLMMALQLKVLPGAEKGLPEPAMGNMKPTTPGYAEKWEEKRAKQIEELKDEPSAVSIEQVSWAFNEAPILTGTFLTFLRSLQDSLIPHDIVVSPSPSRDIKAVVCECLRRELNVPEQFPFRGANILRLFGAAGPAMIPSTMPTGDAVKKLLSLTRLLGWRALELSE